MNKIPLAYNSLPCSYWSSKRSDIIRNCKDKHNAASEARSKPTHVKGQRFWCKDQMVQNLWKGNMRLDFTIIKNRDDETVKCTKMPKARYFTDSNVRLTDTDGNNIESIPMAKPISFNKNRFEPLTISENRVTDLTVKGNCNQNQLNICLWNAQSVKQKTQLIKEMRNSQNLDILLFVETWLNPDDHAIIGELESEGECQFMHSPRTNRTGGGVGCLIRSGLKAKKKDSVKFKTFEHMEIEVETTGRKLSIATIYRPEPSSKNKYNMDEFYEEFTKLLAHYQTYSHEIIVTGDFNFHMNKPNDPRAKQFKGILEMFDLVQHVNSSTHKAGNILDLVITQQETNLSDCMVGDMNSDHSCINFHYKWPKPRTKVKEISVRKTRSININNFKNDLKMYFAQLKQKADSLNYLDELITAFNESSEILNKHAPAKRITVRMRKPTPWNNADIKEMKLDKRRAEKKWRQTKLQADWESFKEKRNAYNSRLNELRSIDLKSKIAENKNNTKAMFKVLNSSLNRKQEQPLPEHSNAKTLANEFNSFFNEKITNIRSRMQNSNDQDELNSTTYSGPKLDKFKELSQQELKLLIKTMPVKHCQLDPLPTWLIINCLDEVLPILTKIVNLSLKLGHMPQQLKHAIVKPTLKKPGLELENKNYRPVSNLSFLGKLIESAVIKQYISHITNNNLDDKRQSAYKQYHSTETLLTKIHNDIIMSLGKGEITMLVLLDLSAAFDTIDHEILLQRLKNRHGIEGKALEWFRSYTTNRTQSVIINDKISDKLDLKYGVPQGSKLGPILFNSYIAPVSEMADMNNINDEKYADDQQLILSFKPTIDGQEDAKKRMEKCIEDIRLFLNNNMLCNNSDKTELLIIGTPQQLNKLQISSISVDNVEIKATDCVRNLGVMFDKNMSMENHVNKMCRNVYYNIKNISRIRKSLDKANTKTVVNALVTPHMDYGNGLLLGISKKLENKLQVAQNSAVRLIEQLKRHDSITNHRKNLHWLPIPARCQFKALTTVWKALNDQAPDYIKKLIALKRTQNINLRSNTRLLLEQPNLMGNKFDKHAFACVVPKLWNELPETLKNSNSLNSFKKNLKTYLFRKFY